MTQVLIRLNGTVIARDGARDPGYTEECGQQLMAGEEIVIGIDLGRGSAGTVLWTSDLSHDYVRINAEYRS